MTPHRLSERFADPDLVDRIFDYVVELLPEIAGQAAEVKRAVRDEFGGDLTYVRARADEKRAALARKVLEQFNGRNATEIARRLGVGRTTVYRILKQPGIAKPPPRSTD